MKFRMVLACGLLLTSGWASAQNQAQQNLQQQQWQQEQTRRGYQAQQDAYAAQQQEMPAPPSQPTGEWILTWGSIANGTNGQGGVSVGQLSKSAAENEAVNQCASGGGVGCKPSLTYKNQCVAVTDNAGYRAGSIERAQELVVDYCRKKGGSQCEILYSACSDPIFRRY